jgi:hypothetical protein
VSVEVCRHRTSCNLDAIPKVDPPTTLKLAQLARKGFEEIRPLNTTTLRQLLEGAPKL